MADRVGQQLGNYRLIRLLGRGGFAEVYLGEHQRLQTQVAIKVLRTQLADDDVEGFLKEARTIAHLEHPHIVRVLDFDVEEGTPFLVMSYAPNGNLRQRQAKGTILPLDTIVFYVKQVTDALQYAHDEKLIHRDIKPENMLLGRHNDVLLSDFGIALVVQSSRLESTQEVIGTAAYMAPEQFQGKPRFASDQYALGVVVYEWLSGERPFNGNFTELYSQHMFVFPPSLHKKIPTISPAVERVVLTALAKDAKDRFNSVRTFSTALEQSCQHSQPIQPRPVTPSREMTSTHRLSPPTKRVVSSLPNQLPQSTNVITPSGSLSQPTANATPFIAPVTSPSPTKETITSSGSQPSKRGISRRAVLVGLAGLTVAGSGITWLVRSQKPQVSSLTPSLFIYHGHTDTVNAVTWSPNGKRIASGSADKTVQVWDATTGNNVFTYHGHSDKVTAVVWSPDAEYIASAIYDKTVQVWKVP